MTMPSGGALIGRTAGFATSFRRHRFSAPGAEIPEILRDAPLAVRAGVATAGELPWLLHLGAAPRAIAHERHQRAPAARVRAFRDIAPVAVAAVRLRLEAGAVAPGAVVPVAFHAALAARALRGQGRLAAARRVLDAAPRAGVHALRNRSLAAPALVTRVEHALVEPLELAPLLLAPGEGRLLLAGRAAARPAGARAHAPERRIHLLRVAPAVGRVELDRLLEELDEGGAHPGAHALMARQRPRERPLRQRAREHAIQDEAAGKHVRLEFRAAHGLLGRDVVDGAGARGLQGAQADLRESEVGELQGVVREQ